MVVVCAAALLASASALADPASIASKQAEAQRVLGQLRELDSSLEQAVEAYNLANIRLEQIKRDLRTNAHELRVTRANLRVAERTLSARLVSLYTSGESNSALEVLLGSRSLSEILNGLETVNRVSDQDAHVLDEVVRFRNEIKRREARLKAARARQAELVAQRAAQRRSVETQLAQRRQLLSSIRGEIERMQAAEAARQAELKRQLRARLASQQQQAAVQALTPNFSSSPEAIVTAPPSRYGGVVGIAMRYLGTPYVWGGASPAGFDCSGFVMYVFAQVGVSLPHNAAAQYGYGTPVAQSQLQPGDLVFFDGLGHDGIYIGNGQFIHSPHSGDVVKISSMTGWYASTYVGARRL